MLGHFPTNHWGCGRGRGGGFTKHGWSFSGTKHSPIVRRSCYTHTFYILEEYTLEETAKPIISKSKAGRGHLNYAAFEPGEWEMTLRPKEKVVTFRVFIVIGYDRHSCILFGPLLCPPPPAPSVHKISSRQPCLLLVCGIEV